MRKRVFYFSIAIILLILVWLGLERFHDELPDIGRDAFYANKNIDIPDNQNLTIAIAGITAPIGKDVIKHGRFVVDAINTSLDLGIDTQEIIDSQEKLSFSGNSDELECWIDDAIEKTISNCASPERIRLLLMENQELLKRYIDLFGMQYWKGTSGNGQYLINLNKLIAAEIKLETDKKNTEAAYKKWLANFKFISRVLKHEGNSIDRAIFLVAQGMNLNSLEYMFYKSPDISTTRLDELNTLLKDDGLEGYNLKGVLRVEYFFINENFITKQVVAIHPEFIRNRIYRYQLDYLEKAQQPISTLDKNQTELKEKYGLSANNFLDDLLDPTNSLVSKHLLEGQFRSLELVKSIYAKVAMKRLLRLSIKIRQQRIEYADIQNFVEDAGAAYNNPFTGHSMQWNVSKKVLYCDYPGNNYQLEVRL